jgi:hypothetical protein
MISMWENGEVLSGFDELRVVMGTGLNETFLKIVTEHFLMTVVTLSICLDRNCGWEVAL